ncbi:GNAT family N-acetyltransferase [Pendulispora albinea]|uniref:GNAT family N-acetyltransferase n=1 Tax=Pendulispora albinea TaxID=2741071 RepID=A0ABZ2M6B0_9BACT
MKENEINRNQREGTAFRAPLRVLVRELTPADAEAIAQWRYEGPWSIYDPRPTDGPLEASDGYFAVVDAGGEGALVGFACVGAEARVPGLSEEPGVVDVGVGMRPDLVGRGLGGGFLGAVMDFVCRRFGASSLRAVVQSWNERSLRLTARLGFRVAGAITCVQEGRAVEYLVLRWNEGSSPPP